MEFVLNGLITVVVGLALWATLPRGVVLTRELQFRGPDGEPQYNTWQVRNDSALPVTIIGVSHSGIHAFNPDTDRIEERELPPWVPAEEEDDLGSP